VSEAVDRAREEGLTLVPVCAYARHWLETHPDAATGVNVDWPDGSEGSGSDDQPGAGPTEERPH
jgi:hypothetical protein